jgi:acyl-[acyl-carrier-protein] desaturase
METKAGTAPLGTGARLSPAEMGALAADYFQELDVRPWHRFSAFDWSRLTPSLLPEGLRSALSFITYIEDHLPGYFLEYQLLFPVDAATPPGVFLHNRELYRFTVKWAQEEDAHAHVLYAYQVRAGLADAEELRARLGEEGQKPFRLEAAEPIQVFAYTLIQEKATQLFYQQLGRAVEEPVLKEILRQLTRDEARHFAFFSRVVRAYLERFGEALMPALRDALQGFKMPLAETLRGYWRWSLKITEAVGGYDHTAAYEDLIRVVRSCAEAPSWSKARDLEALVRALRGIT